MAIDAQNRIHLVWPTLVTDATAAGVASAQNGGSSSPAQRALRLEAAAEPNIALFYAMSTDGKQFTVRERIPTEGVPHHPRIVVAADGALTVAWDEGANGLRRVAIGHGTADDSGRLRFRRELLRTGGSAVYPALAVAGDGVVAAWAGSASAESSIQVARLVMSVQAGTTRSK